MTPEEFTEELDDLTDDEEAEARAYAEGDRRCNSAREAGLEPGRKAMNTNKENYWAYRTAKETHRKAMSLADQSLIAHKKGNPELAYAFIREAFEAEKDAALLLIDSPDIEPSRSVLFRSAASLALQCGEFREARCLIKTALSGNPPEEIADELRELWKQIT